MDTEIYHCPACPIFLHGTRKDYLGHVARVHEKLWELYKCGKKLIREIRYDMHMQNKHDIKPSPKPDRTEGMLQCLSCACNFSHKPSLTRHMAEKHNGEKPQYHQCELCDSCFSRKETLTAHLQKQHRISPKSKRTKLKPKPQRHTEAKYMCVYCSKLFKNPSNLKIHERVHREEEPYVCSYCSKSFARKLSLVRHETKHEGSIKCPICQGSFSSESALDCHMETHCDDKKHICNVCGHKCSNKYHLNQHLKTHDPSQQARQFECLQCDFSATCQSKLDQHMYKHTREKRYECKTCFKTFYRSDRLREHNLVHRFGKPHVCVRCDSAFLSRATLASHVKKMHPGEITGLMAKAKADIEQKMKLFDETKLDAPTVFKTMYQKSEPTDSVPFSKTETLTDPKVVTVSLSEALQNNREKYL